MTSGRSAGRVCLGIKRALDVTGASVLLVVSAPVLAISLAAVWLDSGRPLIHRRRVVGRFGRPFDAFKIRTMVPDADQRLLEDAALHDASTESRKLPSDPRVTRSGSWLRRTSLDELPQLVNVIRGDMSLVGPRMLTREEIWAWGPTADLILEVRPGITGLWQVSGRQNLSREDRIRLDREYVQRMSVSRDLRILARTIPAVISGRGAL
jgi:lipopolysaccharide/colanic/teichoic acid biosynthesis glycosyltransferase